MSNANNGLEDFKKAFSKLLLKWYELHKRDLPWRGSSDPYVIWLSEIILQQTRIAQGLPYFEKFLSVYPTIELFAAADEQQILKLWQGLGYYSRARNMLVCAKEVVEKYDGKFPTTYDELLKLKGVGSYTAAAMASFSFGQPVPVLDGNVFRVLARVFGLEADIARTANHRLFWTLASELISQDQPGLFNQALMDFGSLHCTPKSPMCEGCVFETQCFANQQELQPFLPVKINKIKKKIRYFNYFVLICDGVVLIKKREQKDIWQGMFEFLLLESHDQPNDEYLANNELSSLMNEISLTTSSEIFKHILSHQTIFAQFHTYAISNVSDFEQIKKKYGMQEIAVSDLNSLPISRLVDKFLKKEGNYLT